VIRIIHNIGGCGGTLLSRCLGVLPGVALLSEMNPGAVKLFPTFDPLYQDAMWLGLLDAENIERFSRRDLRITENFREFLQLFYDRASAAGRHLVIHDFNYLDFVGVPFVAVPSRQMMLYAALPHGVPTKSVAFIRHPVDQWLSLCTHDILKAALNPSDFCDAYDAFLRGLGTIAVHKYEDFVERPEAEFQAICRELSLPFDISFRERFHTFDFITGNVARLRDQSISPPQRKAISPVVLAQFYSSNSFRRILGATGYAEQTCLALPRTLVD
jgi:hypothetical protein